MDEQMSHGCWEVLGWGVGFQPGLGNPEED